MNQNAEILQKAISGSLKIIEQDREREIISRRFGLNGGKETLEQIGETLSITRERVRQLEKAILIHLQISAEEGHIPEIAAAEKILVRNLTEMGRLAKLSDLADKVYDREATGAERAGINFIATFARNLMVVEENDRYYSAVLPAVTLPPANCAKAEQPTKEHWRCEPTRALCWKQASNFQKPPGKLSKKRCPGMNKRRIAF